MLARLWRAATAASVVWLTVTAVSYPQPASAGSPLVQGWHTGFFTCQINPSAKPNLSVNNSPGYADGWVQGCYAGRASHTEPKPPSQTGYGYSGQFQIGYASGWYGCWSAKTVSAPPMGDVFPDWGNGWADGCADAIGPSHSPKNPGTGSTSSGGSSSARQGGGTKAQAHITGVYPAAGPTAGGNTVRISGWALTGATSVAFGAKAAQSFTVASDTEIDAVTPPGNAGTTVSVKVSTPEGASTATSAGIYTYQVGQFTAGFAPQDASPGQTVTVSGTAPVGAVLGAYAFCPNACGAQQQIDNTFCSGLCWGDDLGQASVDANGDYAFQFAIPSGAVFGSASVMVGCDQCGAGWVAANGLAIVPPAGRAAPPPGHGFYEGSAAAGRHPNCASNGYAQPSDRATNRLFVYWDFRLGYQDGCIESADFQSRQQRNSDEQVPAFHVDTLTMAAHGTYDVAPGARATVYGWLRYETQPSYPANYTAVPWDRSGDTVRWTLYFTKGGRDDRPAIKKTGSFTLGGWKYRENNFSFPVTAPSGAQGNAFVRLVDETPNLVDPATFWAFYVVGGPMPALASVASVTPSRGRFYGGDAVTITGQGFTGAGAVAFGTAAASSFKVVSNKRIRAVTPPGRPGVSVSVTVTAPTGTSVAGPTFTYATTPAVSGSFTPSAAVASGQQVTASGIGPASTQLSSALFCSGGCDGESVDSIQTDGQGRYRVSFTSSYTGNLGAPYALEIGCNACDGWTGVDVVPASAQPTVTGVDPRSGRDSGKQKVTVKGRNLSGATAVSFGAAGPGRDIQLAADGKSLTVVAPPASGDGPVDVQVTTPVGTSAVTSADQYTYQSPQSSKQRSPSTTGSFSPTSAAPGQSVTLSGTARPANFMSAYLYCKGCAAAGTRVGVAQVGSDGSYSLSFRIPSGAQPGAATVAAGCDACGNNWSTFGGLTITSASSTTQPTPTVPSQPSSGTPPPPGGAPVVTGVTPSSGLDTGGQTVTITGSNLIGASSVNFGDLEQGQILEIASDGASLRVKTPSAWWGDGPVYVQVTTPAGSSAVTAAAQYTYQPVPSSASSAGPTMGVTPGGAAVDCSSPSLTPFEKQVDGCP